MSPPQPAAPLVLAVTGVLLIPVGLPLCLPDCCLQTYEIFNFDRLEAIGVLVTLLSDCCLTTCLGSPIWQCHRCVLKACLPVFLSDGGLSNSIGSSSLDVPWSLGKFACARRLAFYNVCLTDYVPGT